MTNISTIEDVLENILGLVLGGAPGQHTLATSGTNGGGQVKSAINNGFRPESVKNSGSWLIAQSSTLTHTGGWAPEYNKEAITFYKWTEALGTKRITRVTVWVGLTNRDNRQGQEHNFTDPNQVVNPTANPVITLGKAWETIRNEIPQVAGPGTSFDPNSIMAVREILSSLNTFGGRISGGLADDLTKVNTKSDEFKGSAESSWYHRVQVADHFLNDIDDQFTRWDTALKGAGQSATDFVTALNNANHAWSQIPPGNVWHNPYRVIAAMFNHSTLDLADVHNGQSNSWDLGTQYANTGAQYGEVDADGNPVTGPVVMWKPPAWLGFPHPIDAFDVNAWSAVDLHLRQKWAENVINTFAPVLPAAANLITAFADARNKLNIVEPVPVAPLPMPNNLGMPNGNNNLFPNGNPFANWGNPFANFGNPFANFGNPFANFGNPFANFGNPFANFGNPFANFGNPFANSGGGGMDNPFANGPDGTNFLSALASPFPNAGLDSGLRQSLLADPFANAPGGGFESGLLNPGQLFDPFANSAGNPFLSSNNPFANGGGDPFLSSSNPFAGGTQFPQALGDLNPNQLRQLAASGLLDDNPLTPQQMEFLRANGLGVPEGEHPTLGQLTAEQRNALLEAGLLDQIPLSADERANLGLPDLGAPPGFSSWQSLPVDTNPFPTTVNGVDVSPPGAGGFGSSLGDVTQPGAATFTRDPAMLLAGTGGLSGVPGISGSPGALNSSGLGATFGGGSGAGAGGTAGAGGGPGASGAPGAGGFGAGGAGMPFMPPMMPPMFGGPGSQDRDRQRNTWLKEDEKVWGTDPECAPAVIGKRGKGSRPGDEDEYPTRTEQPPQDERRPYRGR